MLLEYPLTGTFINCVATLKDSSRMTLDYLACNVLPAISMHLMPAVAMHAAITLYPTATAPAACLVHKGCASSKVGFQAAVTICVGLVIRWVSMSLMPELRMMPSTH
jgi:hypothetical protein